MRIPLWSAFQKQRAIRSYMRRLPQRLAKNYGVSRSYTAQQVRAEIGRGGLNTDYACYALAMFTDRDGFDRFHADAGERCDYDGMRSEISARHFHGATDFTLSDIADAYAEPTAATHGSHDAGGTDGGHGGHGNH